MSEFLKGVEDAVAGALGMGTEQDAPQAEPAAAAASPPAQPAAEGSGIPDLTPAFRVVAPLLRPDQIVTWRNAFISPMLKANVTTPRRIAALLAQCAVESTAFTILSEDLYYRTPERVVQVFGAHIPTVAMAEAYLCDPQKLGDFVYANRNGNGPVGSGDGYRFRGGGVIQLTGRQNYQRCADGLGMPIDQLADYIHTPAGGAASACWYWADNHINALADAWEITQITQRVNGGQLAAVARRDLSNRALAALGG